MPSEAPVFLVNAHHEPVVVRIAGRATLHNSAPLKRFFQRMIDQGRRRYLLDFQDCTGVDSTFLGILAGTSIQLLQAKPQGTITLARMSDRVGELVRNLGLHKLPTIKVVELDGSGSGDAKSEALPAEKLSEREGARMILQAHENLVEIDASNRAKFQDVIAFLKSQTE
ncbi:MAG: STAS domain-containing protein [Verrucomicrobiota bacterium JB022]|nr:STAS domain-containing protein [Verrucomicrobiota bacterium JB022]